MRSCQPVQVHSGPGRRGHVCQLWLPLIYKGRTIARESDCDDDCGIDCEAHDDERATPLALSAGMTLPSKDGIANVMVSGSVTTASGIRELNSSRSDPMMSGFDDEGSSSGNGSIDPSFPTPMGTVALSSGQKVHAAFGSAQMHPSGPDRE